MIMKLLSIAVGLVALCACAVVAETPVPTTTASEGSTDDMSDIPLCPMNKNITSIVFKNPRKKQCEQIIKAKELTLVKDAKILCDQSSCIASLKYLYVKMPLCRFEQWAVKLNAGNLLRFCGIDPATAAASAPSDAGSAANGATISSSGSTDGTVTKPPATTKATWTVGSSSSSKGGDDFAPVGTPAPQVTTQSPSKAPTPNTSSGAIAVGSAAVTALAAILVIAH